jgi:hypothetical protein
VRKHSGVAACEDQDTMVRKQEFVDWRGWRVVGHGSGT